jgi:hypothetical protein
MSSGCSVAHLAMGPQTGARKRRSRATARSSCGANTEHHSIGLFPLELRSALGAGDHGTLLAFGVQVGSYEQLRAAKTFLENRGVKLDTAGQEHSSA